MRISSDTLAGILITVIAHLAVIIVLLCTQLSDVRSETELIKEAMILIDFTNDQPELKQQDSQDEESDEYKAMKEEIARKLDEKISNSSPTHVSNAALNSKLRDAKGTDAEKLYRDAERLERELRNGYVVDDSPATETKKQDKTDAADQTKFSGSVLVEWTLDGREKRYLKIPGYKAYGGGVVSVAITVDESGKVISADIKAGSSPNKELQSLAIQAAMNSRFNAKSGAGKQRGEIIYTFVAQRG